MSDFRLNDRWLGHIGIPIVHWEAKLKDIPDRCPHKKYIKEYLEKLNENILDGRGLYLWGDFGRGKSAVAAIILMRAAMTCSCIGFWIRAKEIPTHIINRTDFDDEITVIERAETCSILVIDEFQIRFSETKYTEWSAEDLIRKRVDSKLPTIITSNLAPAIVEKEYPALYSVLLESVLPVKVYGYDFRKGKAGKNGYEDI